MDTVNTYNSQRTIIRIGHQSMAFALPAGNNNASTQYEPYTVKSGMSMAANLREAFKENDILLLSQNNAIKRVQVLIDTPTLIIPIEEYNSEDNEAYYNHVFPDRKQDVVLQQPIAELNCVAIFSINKDLRTVINDHFADVRIQPLMVDVWTHLHHGSYATPSQKLYAYFHDQKVDIFAFRKNRFRFVNSYRLGNHSDATNDASDATYFAMYVWKQLAMEQKKDELYLLGELPTDIKETLQKYVQNVFPINASAEFNRTPVTQLKGITYDVVCHLIG